LRSQDGQLTVSVRDNGKGINAGVVECRPECLGVGLAGMRQRVKEFGGQFHMENLAPGTGIEICIPLGTYAGQETTRTAVPPKTLHPSSPPSAKSMNSTSISVGSTESVSAPRERFRAL
jgi:hypothetical protein